MEKINIVNWNSQGGAATQEKRDALANQLSDWNKDGQGCIVFLEEAGVPGWTGYTEGETYSLNGVHYTCIASCVDPKARNQRCTVSVLMQRQLIASRDVEINYLVQGANRLVPYVVYNHQIVFAGMHAIANLSESVSEVTNIIRYLDRDEAGNKKMPWMLVGDFNSEPSCYSHDGRAIYPNCLNTIQYDGTKTRPHYCKMVYSSEPTQGPDGERVRNYDYAFMQETIVNVNTIDNVMIYGSQNQVLSDHNMICVGLTI
ncbi:MAG: endonuclease/exonuclease/phosphatase family protein [Lachnospira sp.]|nr:endonuclease/exonuclease/phosphatase family protein [Lachnospira sp.]